ncbi:hypothetical protein HUB94_25600 (plasmid) [Paenibacillus cellulosilyticus]|nr:hypothetical protein HUB94_25600 [Paenibacillus cellulosilyticus]
MVEGLDCLRCSGDMQFLKEYRFDSRDNNRGIFGALFDVEEHLTFNVYVCPNCGHSEFFHTGIHKRLGD